MKNKLVLVSGAVLAVGAMFLGMMLLGLSPRAHANKDSFLNEVRAAGILVDEAGAMRNVWLTCQWMGQMPSGEVAEKLSSGSGLDMGHTVVFIALTVKEYCPQYLDHKITPRTPNGLTPKHQPGDDAVVPELVSRHQPQEDEPGWDCRTMGNRICGPGNDQGVEPGDYSEETTYA